MTHAQVRRLPRSVEGRSFVRISRTTYSDDEDEEDGDAGGTNCPVLEHRNVLLVVMRLFILFWADVEFFEQGITVDLLTNGDTI